MIISRSPLRISLGGGGTDLPSYYKKKEGSLIAATIDKYIYITIGKTFNQKYILKYSKSEEVNNINKIKHPLFRETLKYFKLNTPVNISSHADIPSGTGLGSSGSFTVCLINAILSLKSNKNLSKKKIAEVAFNIEHNILKEPVGKQDQYASCIGGINEFIFKKNGSVLIKKINLKEKNLKKLNNNLVIFFTGYSRSSYKILKHQNQKTLNLDKKMIKNLDMIKEIGKNSKKALIKNNFDEFGEILDYHWQIKKKRSNDMSNKRINYLYDLAKDYGAIGGKLIGAGGGGFLMFYTNKPKNLSNILEKKIEKLNYQFEFQGSKIISN